jgi:hypothetical protein
MRVNMGYFDNPSGSSNSSNTNIPQNRRHYENSSYQEQMPATRKWKPPGKKSRLKLIIVLVIIFLITGGGSAFAFRDTLSNTFSLMTKSPINYYSSLEKQTIKKTSEKLSDYVKLAQKDIAYDSSTEITYDHDTINALLNSFPGISMDNLENSLGISLKNIGVDTHTVIKGGNIYGNLNLRINKTDIIEAVLLFDTLKNIYLVNLPDLSPAYLNISTSSLIGTDSANQLGSTAYKNTICSVLDSAFITKYTNLLIDQIDQVELDKNAEIKTNSLSASCNKLTVTITDKDLEKMLVAVLKEAKSDKIIIDYLLSIGVAKEDYQAVIQKLLESIDAYLALDNDTCIKMLVYTDNNGNILGRQFSKQKKGISQGTLGYTFIGKGKNIEFELYMKDNSDTALARCYGNCTKKNKAYSGSAALEFMSATDLIPIGINLNIDFEDFRTVIMDKKFYQYGKLILSSPLLMGAQIALDNDVKDDTQLSNFAVQMGSSTLLTIDSEFTYLDDYTIPKSDEEKKIYDISDLQSYISSFDITSYIFELSKRLGVDEKKLIENFN